MAQDIVYSLWKHKVLKTLHTGSFLGLKIRTLKTDMDIKTIRFNVPGCFPLNADYDGDESNIHVGQNVMARAEMEELLSVRKNTMMSKGPFTLLALSQDTIIGIYLITLKNKLVDVDEWNDIASYSFLDRWSEKFWNPTERTTYSLISLCLPPDFNYNHKGVIIKNGILISGTITKEHISNKPFGIPRMVLCTHDEDVYIDFMNCVVHLVNGWLAKNSLSFGIGDCVLSKEVTASVKNEVIENIMKLTMNISKYDNNDIIIDRSVAADGKIYHLLNNSKELGNKIIDKNMSKHNNLKLVVDSGAKGNYVNIFQITAMLGQQILEGKRLWPSYYRNRSLPCYFPPEIANVYKKHDSHIIDDVVVEKITPGSEVDQKSENNYSVHYSNRDTGHSKTQLRYPWSWSTMPIVTVAKPKTNTNINVVTTEHIKKIDDDNTFKDYIKMYYESGGFIMSSLLEGLNPREFFYHAMSGREGLISTSCSTASSGYLERRLTKMMEDVQVSYNGNIINGVTNKIVRFSDSEDCFNNSMLIGNRFILPDKLFSGL